MSKQLVVIAMVAGAAKVAVIESDLMIWSADCWAEQLVENINQAAEIYPDLEPELVLISNPPIYADKIQEDIEALTNFTVKREVI